MNEFSPDRALVGNAADEEQVTKAEEKENRDRNELENAWRDCMALPQFRTVMRDLWKFCEPFATPFRGDDRRTCVAIGRAEVARYTVERMEKVNPEFFVWLTQATLASSKRKRKPNDGRSSSSSSHARRARARADRQE